MSREMEKLESACKAAAAAIKDKMGIDVKLLDIHEITVLSDFFIIATGNNINQLKAMADETCKKLGELGYNVSGSEGYQTGGWILLDFGFLIVHLFGKNEREFYNLERIWADAKEIPCE